MRLQLVQVVIAVSFAAVLAAQPPLPPNEALPILPIQLGNDGALPTFDGLLLGQARRSEVRQHFADRLVDFETCNSNAAIVTEMFDESSPLYTPLLIFGKDDRLHLVSMRFRSPQPIDAVTRALRIAGQSYQSSESPPSHLYANAHIRVRLDGTTATGLDLFSDAHGEPLPTPQQFVHCPAVWIQHGQAGDFADPNSLTVRANVEGFTFDERGVIFRSEIRFRNRRGDWLQPSRPIPSRALDEKGNIRFAYESPTQLRFFKTQVHQIFPYASLSSSGSSQPVVATVRFSAAGMSSQGEAEFLLPHDSQLPAVHRAIRLWQVSQNVDAIEPSASSTSFRRRGILVSGIVHADGLAGKRATITLSLHDPSGKPVRLRPPPYRQRPDEPPPEPFLTTTQIIPSQPRLVALPRFEIFLPYSAFDRGDENERNLWLTTQVTCEGLAADRCESVVIRFPNETSFPPVLTRRTASFLGVIPGKTTRAELEANPRWGVARRNLIDATGTVLREHHVLAYDAVVAIQGDVVRTIDVSLPPETTPATMQSGMKIGITEIVKELPIAARIGPPIDSRLQAQLSTDSAVVLFVEESSTGAYVHSVRFFDGGEQP